MPMRESNMVRDALQRVQCLGVEAATEVPLLHRSIDLVMREGSLYVAVEFKVNDWKRAISQATDHLVAADLVYVCLPSNKIGIQVLLAAEERGIGIMSYDPGAPMMVVAHPPRLADPWVHARGWLEDAFSVRINDAPKTAE